MTLGAALFIGIGIGFTAGVAAAGLVISSALDFHERRKK